MTQEEKELLFKDLCARLPYGVKVQYEDKVYDVDYISPTYEEIKLDSPDTNFTIDVLDIKPYLFPLSSITEEQKKELQSLMISDSYGILYHTLESFNYMCKNNIDFRGLIPMGLAIDATGKNIY